MAPVNECLTRFVANERRRGLAPATVDARVRLLRRLSAACGDLFAVTADEFERWIDSLALSSPNSRATAISHVHQFYKWSIRHGLTTTDPTVFVDRPRVRQGLPRPIHPTDLSLAVLAACGPMRVALLLAATSGMRCCEIARLRWDDVHDGRARVLGKGSRERVVPLHPVTVAELDNLPRSSVFVLDDWQSKNRDAPGLRVSQRGNKFLHGLGVTATMHQLRHYCGTEALRGCGNLRKVQTLLGHASPATTAVYTRLDVDELIDVVERIPLGLGDLR